MTAKPPSHGPSRIPTRGAKTTPPRINLSCAPTIGNRDQKEKTAYKAAKSVVKARVFDEKKVDWRLSEVSWKVDLMNMNEMNENKLKAMKPVLLQTMLNHQSPNVF